MTQARHEWTPHRRNGGSEEPASRAERMGWNLYGKVRPPAWFGLRQRNFHAVNVERLVEPFQCDAPNALQAQRFACAQLRNRVGG